MEKSRRTFFIYEIKGKMQVLEILYYCRRKHDIDLYIDEDNMKCKFGLGMQENL